MRKIVFVLGLAAVMMAGCTRGNDAKGTVSANDADFAAFDRTMQEADSLYNNMDFRLAYDLYLQLLDSKGAKADDERMLNVLNSLCMASELSEHKAEQTQWLEQLLDLARETGNAYYEAFALMSMGKRLYYEGDKEQGIQYMAEAVDRMAETDRPDTDHLTSSMLIMLAGLYNDMNDPIGALPIDERNVALTHTGTRWTSYPNLQLIDRRMALAKMAYTLAKLGNYHRADSAYVAWQAVQYEGNHVRDYFIVDYLRERGRYREAEKIYLNHIDRIRAQGDTLGEMMNNSKWGLAEIYQNMGEYKRAAELYVQVLEIQDTLKSRTAQNTAQELAAAYQTQELQQQLMEEQMHNTRQHYWLALIALLLIAATGYTMSTVRKNRIISQKNQSLAAQITEALKYKELYREQQTEKEEAKDAEPDLSTISDEQLFRYVSNVIERERLFMNPNFGRQTIMERFHLSKERVGNMFSQSEHSKLTNYIQQLRMEYAAKMLVEQPAKSIVQIAQECGFRSHKYFTDRFRQYYNMTPSEFRTAQQQTI